MSWSLAGSRAVYAGAYVAAMGIAVASVYLAGQSPVASTIVAGGVATLFLYLCGIVFKNSGFYDVYWSVYPMIAAAYWMVAFDATNKPRAWMALGIAALWGGRLTFNWVSHFRGLDVEDWRYTDLRQKTGGAYQLAALGALHLLPFTLVTLGTLPLAAAISSDKPIGPIDVAAVVVGVVAVVLEAVSDIQLHAFQRENKDPKRFMQTGLWGLSRHPNYCGEAMYWWAAAMFGLAIDLSPTHLLGALGVTAMIVGASIPMAEKRALSKRPDFADYQRRVSRLIPWFPKR